MDHLQHIPRFTTLTFTDCERAVITRCLTIAATVLDAHADYPEAMTALELAERVRPEGLDL